MTSFNSSYIGLRPDMLKYITGKNLIVLDVGCATGENGRFLLKNRMASTVVGIEFNDIMAKKAEDSVTYVFQGDLNKSEFRKIIISNSPQYDYIIFGDILEHLLEPEEVLKDLIKQLKPSGKVIISLPNIAHIELFIQIYIKGIWPENQRGIFDRTHLRWFTRLNAFLMVENCGLQVINYQRNYRSRDALGSTFNWKYRIIKWINKDWVTFQHIIVCNYE